VRLDSGRGQQGEALQIRRQGLITQQAADGRPQLDHKTLDEEIDEELKAKASDPKTLDPSHPEYARTLQSHGHDITHDKAFTLLPEPKDPKAKEAWKRQFQKSGRVRSREAPNSTSVQSSPSRA